MDLNISKAKLTKKGCLEVVYADKEGNDIVFKGINPVHPDLKDSLTSSYPTLSILQNRKNPSTLIGNVQSHVLKMSSSKGSM